jgi:hypothetical protein
MSGHPHLAIYPLPIVHEGADVEALCAVVVEDARFAMAIDVAAAGEKWSEFLTSLNSCPKCFGLVDGIPKEDVRYVYLIVPDEKMPAEVEPA